MPDDSNNHLDTEEDLTAEHERRTLERALRGSDAEVHAVPEGWWDDMATPEEAALLVKLKAATAALARPPTLPARDAFGLPE